MTNNSNFYFDGVRGMYLIDGVIKFNLISDSINTNKQDETLTLITSFSRFESLVNFFNIELEKMKNIQYSDKTKTNNLDVKMPSPKKGKIILSEKGD